MSQPIKPSEKDSISPKFVRWVLYSLPYLQAAYEKIEPGATMCMVPVPAPSMPSSKTERIAIKRAAIVSVIDATEKAILSMTPRQNKIYRMRFLARLSYKDIRKVFGCSDKTVERRVTDIVELVGNHIKKVPAKDLQEFKRFYSE